MPSLSVEVIGQASDELEQVLDLWGRNRGVLGLFPRGAFEEYAAKGQILVARSAGSLAGYLLYRTSRHFAVIVHLVVDENYRGEGVAAALFSALRDLTTQFEGIRLKCRRDYPASRMWPRLGFRPVHEREGRSATGELLTTWLYEHDHPSLFSASTIQMEGQVPVVLDSNVVYDLQDLAEPEADESAALLADWLQEEVSLRVAPEVWNDVNRCEDPEERERRWHYLDSFVRLRPPPRAVETVKESLRPLFPVNPTPSDESDLNHLAQAIASEAALFVTRDEPLLELKREVEQRYGLRIRRPVELIVEIDERLRDQHYQPARAAGSLQEMRRVSQEDVESLASRFLAYGAGEKKSSFTLTLRRLLSTPETVRPYVIRNETDEPIALCVFAFSSANVLEVPVLRVLHTRSSPGLVAYMLWLAGSAAATEDRQSVHVTEQQLPKDVQRILGERYFFRVEDGWLRRSIRSTLLFDEVANVVEGETQRVIAEIAPERDLFGGVSGPRLINDPESVSELERTFWPVKIRDGRIPNFIVPIKPHWASHLFDERLAAETLFGARAELAMAAVNVYFRAPVPRLPVSPSRVLWYVSSGEGYSGAMAIRAVSYVREVRVGRAKELFSEHEKIGVYDWTSIRETAREGDVMAFTFSDTELLGDPVPWKDIQDILVSCSGKQNQLQSPLLITPDCFFRLYCAGSGLACQT